MISFIFFINFFFVLMMLLNFVFKKKKEILQIESGFQNLDKTSMKNFSINFFFILIIFIIFDLELILLIPFLVKKTFFFSFISMNFIFFTFLIEWMMNKIIWKNLVFLKNFTNFKFKLFNFFMFFINKLFILIFMN